MPFVENFEEFNERQGCPYVECQPHDRLLYQNTAVWFYYNRYGQEPAGEGSEEWLRRRLEYEQKLLKQLEDRATRLQYNIHSQAQMASQYVNLPPPEERALDALEQMKAELEPRRETVADLTAKLHEVVKQEGDFAYEEHRAAQRERCASILNRLGKIEI